MKTDNVARRSTASCSRYSSHLVKTKHFSFLFSFVFVSAKKRHRCLVKTNIGITWTAELSWPPERSFNNCVTLFTQFLPPPSHLSRSVIPACFPHIMSQLKSSRERHRITVTTSRRLQSCNYAIDTKVKFSGPPRVTPSGGDTRIK